MDSAEKNILRFLSRNEFGIKPLKENIFMALNDHYGIHINTAKSALHSLLTNNLISVDSITGRYSITQKGFRTIEVQDNFEFELTQVDDDKPRPKKSKLSIDWEMLGVVVAIITLIVTIIQAICSR